MKGMRFVYVLESTVRPGRHYVGLTSDAVARLRAHNDGKSRHTAHDRPWKVLAIIEFADQGGAVRFERYLKSGSGRAFARRHFA